VIVNLADPELKWRVLTLSSEKTIGTTEHTDDSVKKATTVKALAELLSTPAVQSDANSTLQSINGSAWTTASETRFVSGKGDLVEIFVFYKDPSDGGVPKIQFKEVRRNSRFETDLSTLVTLVLSGKLPTAKAAGTVKILHETHLLAEDRATLTVGVTPPASKQAGDPPRGLDAIAASIGAIAQALNKDTTVSGPKSDKATENAASADVLTGSPEHWFIAANVNVTRFSQLSFDDKTNSVVPKEKSPQFLLSANYFLGDLASTSSNNVFVGLAIAPTTSPTRAMGPIVGIRLHTMSLGGFSLDAISPYVGYVRMTNEDGTAEGNRVRWHSVVGLQFNLDKLVEWLK
jgi:hypothetical protein